MAIGLATIALTLGSIALFEGVAALLEQITGDPEADVQAALENLAANNQRRALSQIAVEQAGADDLNEKFGRFERIPQRMLTSAALGRMPGSRADGGGQNSELINMVSQRLGLDPGVLNRASSPSRMGDTSHITRRMGRSPAGGTFTGQAPGGGQVQGQPPQGQQPQQPQGQ